MEITLEEKEMHMSKRAKIVQVKNPVTNEYVKIDREKGRIIGHKKTEKPYKGIPISRNRKPIRSDDK